MSKDSDCNDLPEWLQETMREGEWHTQVLTDESTLLSPGTMCGKYAFFRATTLPSEAEDPDQTRHLLIFEYSGHYYGVHSPQTEPFMCFGGPYRENNFCPGELREFCGIKSIIFG